jgi:sulfite oxidase
MSVPRPDSTCAGPLEIQSARASFTPPPKIPGQARGPAGRDKSARAVAVNADILRPDGQAVVPAGPTEITGYAFAGDDRGIARVDVSVDGGSDWIQADLGQDLGPWAWRHWRTTIDLPAGKTEITARAWDTAANVQPESAAHLWNPKGYVNNSWARLSVTAR